MISLRKDLKNRAAYRLISEYYSDKVAKRSNVPLMNHIDEGIDILISIGACQDTIDAYCIHPILQSDDDRSNVTLFFPISINIIIKYTHICSLYYALIVIPFQAPFRFLTNHHVTIGKIYTTIGRTFSFLGSYYLTIINDRGDTLDYRCEDFDTLKESRRNKLLQIL